MKKKLLTLALGSVLTLGVTLGTGFGQATPDIDFDQPDANAEGEVNLNTVEFDTSYVFSSDVEFASKKVGRGSAMHNFFEYIHRVPIQGQWYFQVGATYDRFDFGGSATELLPTTLQSINVPICWSSAVASTAWG